MEEISAVKSLSGARLNMAKSVLAFETTALAHGKEEAVKAYEASSSMFGARVIPENILPSSRIPRKGDDPEDRSSAPSSRLEAKLFEEGIPAFKLFNMVELAGSGGAARRLIEQGGAYVNGKRVEKFDQLIDRDEIRGDEIVLRAGKKRFHKIQVV
jgi:tyrosyl-tRNA synthetase